MTQRQVILEGGLPWGFRMHGGDDLKTPLKISRVNPGSKASQRGIREGDLITSINGQSTKNLTNNEAHNLLKNSDSTITLGLNEDTEGSPKRRQYRTVHQETHQETVKKSSLTYSIKETVETSSSKKANNNEVAAYKRKTNEFFNGRDIKQNVSDVKIVTNIPVSQNSTPSSSSTSTPSTLVPEGKNISSDHAVASRQSSYSNCSSIPDEGLEQEIQDRDCQEMNNAEAEEPMSSSKKRRQRRKNNLLTRSISEEKQNIVEISNVVQETYAEGKKEKTEKHETNKNIEILKLKRIEHKYKVESPKEIKLERVKSCEKKLKAKSKSLDDDEILRIQELSEASESEDTKIQSNIIISEASSEESLLEGSSSDVERKKRAALNSISLELNENNQIELTSHISPAEEQALRSFLGGLNLVESPEQSAKELYEQTAGLTDPKAKKQQKRKELEEYFLPIAENPRFLDAISEEASDISDKETPGSSRIIHHIKQCTPEQDVRHVPPAIPPRANRRNMLNKYGNQVAQPDAVLVETKISTPKGVQETVCSTQIVSSNAEKAEVVYLIDSSESSHSSGDFEEAFNEFRQENDQPVISKKLTEEMNCHTQIQHDNSETEKPSGSETQPKNEIILASDLKNNALKSSAVDNLHVESNESLTTTFSNQTVGSTIINKVSDKKPFSSSSIEWAVLSQLTPPLTPDDVNAKNEKQGNTKLGNSVLFDYTKIPNILSSREPDDDLKVSKSGSMDKNGSEKNIINKDAYAGRTEELIKDTETKIDDKVTKTNVKNHVAAVHIKKKIVNGQLDNMEFRKVKVNEVFKDGEMEFTTDFEEYKDNQNVKHITDSQEKTQMNEEKLHIVRETGKQGTKYKEENVAKEEESQEEFNKNSNCFKCSSRERFDADRNLKNVEEKSTETENRSARYDKNVNKHEKEKVQVNEISESKDSLVNKDVYKTYENINSLPDARYQKTTEKEVIDDVIKTDTTEARNDYSKTKTEHFHELLVSENTSGYITKCMNKEKQDIQISKEYESEKIINDTHMLQTKSENNLYKESINEGILRHVMMTSKDSNKTDIEKLQDFNNILMLNSELKDKISKKELIGPVFRKSKSPSVSKENTDCTMVMNCDELPGKTFVQRRIKEFSEDAHDVEKGTNKESILKQLFVQNGVEEESEEILVNKNFVKSRVTAFSHKEENVLEDNEHKGSILKRLFLNSDTDKTSYNLTKQIDDEEQQNNIPDTNKKLDQKETIIPVVIEKPSKNRNDQEEVKSETIIPEQQNNIPDSNKKLDQKETVIPVVIEKLSKNRNDQAEVKNETIIPIKVGGFHNKGIKASKLEERTIPIEIEKIKNNEETDKLLERNILLQNEDLEHPKIKHNLHGKSEDIFKQGKDKHSILGRLILTNSAGTSNKNKIKIETSDDTETVVPITVEKLNGEKNTLENLKIERVIPVQVECKGVTYKSKEKLLPTTINQTNIYENIEKASLNKASREVSKSLESVFTNNDRIIPIKIENRNRSRIIPVKVEPRVNKLMPPNRVGEKIIPVTIEQRSPHKGVSKSLETILNKTDDTANNERIIPINIENKMPCERTYENQYEKKEQVTYSKERIIPVITETEMNKNLSNITKNTSKITKESLKEVNDCLKNIAGNKIDEKTKNKMKSDKITQEKEDENSNQINETVISITTKTSENTEKKLVTPPIPPPRRSKNNVTKKIYANINISQNNSNDSNKTQHLKDSKPLKETEQNGFKEKISLEKKDPKEKIPVSNDITYTNILSPPRPSSVGSDSSDSGESSRCTAKYNPNSSIADVTSITKEEENGGLKQMYEPLSLRNIVLNLFMSLPFGEEILRELADVSKSIDYYTNNIPFRGLSVTNSDKNNDISENKEVNMPGQWYTQKDVVRNQYGDDRHKILELHKKFLTRRSYSEGDNEHMRSTDDDRVIITGIGSRETEVMSPNRLLTIIREEPSESDNPSEHLYFKDNANQRLKAKNLSEWLTLARHKSKSTSNLDCTSISINNLRKTFTIAQPENAKFSNTRRRSLPQEIYEKQLVDIMEKEREIQRELEKLEDEKRKLRAEIAPSRQKEFQVDDFYVSKRGDFAEMRENIENKQRPMSMPVFPTEFFRQQMYDEYMDKFSEREERKQQKVIKISSSNDLPQEPQNLLKSKEIIHPIELEQEFMDKVKQKLGKNQQNLDDTSQLEISALNQSDEVSEQKTADEKVLDDPPVIVLDGDKVKGVETLPKHLQEFVDDLTALPEESIWSPGQQRTPQIPTSKSIQRTESQNSQSQGDEPISPIWTPKSANSSPTVEKKEFRAVSFQSPVLSRKNRTLSETIKTPDSTSSEPPWKLPEGCSDTAIHLSSSLERRLPTSQSSPGFGSFSTSPRLPKAQNPTITLLQKAREGQLPRGAHYIEQERRSPNDRPPLKYPGEVLYHIKNEYTSESDNERPKQMADLSPRKFEGIGPTSRDGMPLILRSEVREKDQSKWYKRMYDTIHKQKPHRDEFVTVRYKQKRAQYPYTSGYLSEPEPGAYDSDFTDYKYHTLDRRRMPQTQEYISNSHSSTMPRSVPDKSYSSSDIVRNPQEKYQPGRIENYIPGRSSISEKEAKQWWDEVMDIFDGHLEQQNRMPKQKPKSFINQALKESGYESDSTLVFKRKEDTANQLGPKEQRQAYKIIQKGGDVPFQGLRKPAPERPKEPDLPPPPPPPKSQGGVRSQEQESPRKYVENEVTIHYKTPVRTEIKEYVSEDELAHRQAEAMKKIYEEERKRKYFQELQDMKSRRHTDNFIPSQKSPISLNRYDDFDDLHTPTKTRPRSPEPRLVARALYNFVGQTARELTFRKGDLIYVRRQVDKNWYEGELNAMIGLFPVNYVEIVPYEGPKTTPRKAHEGQARAKYNFVAQTHLELSLAKGELVTVTRRVDDNWFEGKIGGRKGIFPVAYVEILIDPSDPPSPSTKPVASPAAHSLLLNGSAQGKDSMGSHLYTPNIPNPITNRDTGYHHAKPVQLTGSGTYSTLPKTSNSPINQTLHIETHSDPVPYRALYRYTPQNDDELELLEGDTVFVLEKCDDGWYVGSSDRTGAFGTFPGNYVEKI